MPTFKSKDVSEKESSVERAAILGVKLPPLPASLVEVLTKQGLREFERDVLETQRKVKGKI